MANGYIPGYQPSYGNPAQMYQRGQVSLSRPTSDPVQSAKDLVFKYNREPKKYSDKQAEKIAFIAARLGLPFKGESKALQKFFFDTIDNIAFGALPESMRPVSRGESVYGETGLEKVAGVASLLGYAVPGALGAKLGTRALQAGVEAGRAGKLGGIGQRLAGAMDKASLMPRGYQATTATAPYRGGRAGRELSSGVFGKEGAPQFSRVASGIRGAAGGSGALALTDIIEDPFGAPSRALTGAVLGGAVGGLAAGVGKLGAAGGRLGAPGMKGPITYVYPTGRRSAFFSQHPETPYRIASVSQSAEGQVVMLDFARSPFIGFGRDLGPGGVLRSRMRERAPRLPGTASETFVGY